MGKKENGKKGGRQTVLEESEQEKMKRKWSTDYLFDAIEHIIQRGVAQHTQEQALWLLCKIQITGFDRL